MAAHSSVLAWKIPWTEEPGRLWSMRFLRVGHDWATSLFTFMLWRRKWHPTPVLLPGKSHGQRSLVGCSPWGCWVGHNWATSLSLFTFMHWRRKWQPTPVFLPGESHGQRSLAGYSPWGRKESDTTEWQHACAWLWLIIVRPTPNQPNLGRFKILFPLHFLKSRCFVKLTYKIYSKACFHISPRLEE